MTKMTKNDYNQILNENKDKDSFYISIHKLCDLYNFGIKNNVEYEAYILSSKLNLNDGSNYHWTNLNPDLIREVNKCTTKVRNFRLKKEESGNKYRFSTGVFSETKDGYDELDTDINTFISRHVSKTIVEARKTSKKYKHIKPIDLYKKYTKE
jgi:hypothetical protein